MTSIQKIRQLNAGQLRRQLPVDIDAQVLWVNPFKGTLFILEGEICIFVRAPLDSDIVQTLVDGDLVRIKGVANEGGFSPDILADSIEVVGHQPKPEPRRLYDNELISPAVDCEWIQMRGRLISKTVQWNSDAIALQISRNNTILNIQMAYSEESERRLEEIMFDFVEFSAVCGTMYNEHRQSVGRVFYSHSASDIVPVEVDPNRKDPPKIMQIHELFRYKESPREEVKTHGVVVHLGVNEIYLRGDQASLKVAVSAVPDIEVGDEVMVTGVVWPQLTTPAFRGRSVEKISEQTIPQPIPVNLAEKLELSRNYDLVEIDAELIEMGKNFVGADGSLQQTLICRSEGKLFEVLFPSGINHSDELNPGALLRLTGICHLIRNTNVSWYFRTDGFSLELRSASDVVILEDPPWWTTTRLLRLLGLVVATMMLFVVWVGLLRNTVRRQTGIIRDKVATESVMTERQRIARELHDTLEQGLTALSVQMKNIRKGFEIDSNSGSRSVDLAENMLRVCRDESRSSIIDLRGGILETMGLPEAIHHTLERITKGQGLKLKVEIARGFPSLNSFAERHLLRMITEASNNVIRHAEAEHLFVKMLCSDDRVELSVEDDGCGFDMKQGIPQGHFGISGLYERANRLHGNLDIKSVQGTGTTLSFSMPVGEFLQEEENHG